MTLLLHLVNNDGVHVDRGRYKLKFVEVSMYVELHSCVLCILLSTVTSITTKLRSTVLEYSIA